MDFAKLPQVYVQGDQIGRKFVKWVIEYVLDSLLNITEVGHIVGLLFSTVKVMHYFLQKRSWATSWAIS
jgi:hypothetical protein